MDAIAPQITSLTIVYSIVYSDADQRKYQNAASLAFVRGIHRWPVNSPHKWPVTRKMFPFDDVIMKRTGSKGVRLVDHMQRNINVFQIAHIGLLLLRFAQFCRITLHGAKAWHEGTFDPMALVMEVSPSSCNTLNTNKPGVITVYPPKSILLVTCFNIPVHPPWCIPSRHPRLTPSHWPPVWHTAKHKWGLSTMLRQDFNNFWTLFIPVACPKYKQGA